MSLDTADPPLVSPFPPIADYGFLSDCETCALVAPSGAIEWMCLPRFDGPSVFAALLDRDAGTFRLGPADTMVPVARYTTVSGIPITELLSADRIAAIAQRTRDGGAEIVKLLKTGSAYYAPAMSAAEMTEAILTDQKRLVPCSVLLQGEYGMKDLFIGVPGILGGKGVEKILKLELAPDDLKALQKSGKDVADAIAELSVGV